MPPALYGSDGYPEADIRERQREIETIFQFLFAII
jgi:hypothetical protein